MNFRTVPQPTSDYEAICFGLTSVFCAVAMLLMYNYCKFIYKRLENGQTMTEAVLFETIDSTPLFGPFVNWLSCVFDKDGPILPCAECDINPAAVSLKNIVVEDDFYFADIPEYGTSH